MPCLQLVSQLFLDSYLPPQMIEVNIEVHIWMVVSTAFHKDSEPTLLQREWEWCAWFKFLEEAGVVTPDLRDNLPSEQFLLSPTPSSELFYDRYLYDPHPTTPIQNPSLLPSHHPPSLSPIPIKILIIHIPMSSLHSSYRYSGGLYSVSTQTILYRISPLTRNREYFSRTPAALLAIHLYTPESEDDTPGITNFLPLSRTTAFLITSPWSFLQVNLEYFMVWRLQVNVAFFPWLTSW